MCRFLMMGFAVLVAATAEGQVKVMDSDDVVGLVSGEEVRGKIIGAGLKAVVIVVRGEEEGLVEQTIPREQVKSIRRGDFSPMIKIHAEIAL